MCGNKDAPVSEFTALLDKGGVRLNIHDEVYRMIEHSTNSVIMLFDSHNTMMAAYDLHFGLCSSAIAHLYRVNDIHGS